MSDVSATPATTPAPAAPAATPAAAAPRKSRKREKRNVNTGVVHIKSTFNNTIVSITDASGNVIAWASSG